ncbi:MAG: O-antigen ligase family protein [Kiritimatiellae bacterium]|nr:O-antigen ligase family protein [Kiritimatiellia bacterium]
MNGLPISPAGTVPRRRKRRKSLPRGHWLYETILLSVLLLAVMLGIFLFGAVRAWSASIVLFLLALVAMGYALRPLFTPGARDMVMPPGLGFLLLFFVYACIRFFWSEIRYEAALDIAKIGGFSLAYAVWSGLGGRYGRWRWLFGVLIFCVTLICWYALIQHVHGSTNVLMLHRPAGYGMRASGTYMCPNHFANLLGMVSCVCAGLLVMPAAGAVLRILSLYSLLLLIPVNYLTQSRSGWIGMAVGILTTLFLVLWRRSRKIFLLALVVAPLLLGGAGVVLWTKSDMVRERIGGMDLSSPDGSVQFRLVIWRETLSMIQDAPVWGHGGGVFRWLHPRYKTTGLQELWARYPHNEYLQLAAEYGIAGLLLVSLAVFFFLWKMLKVACTSERERDTVMAALALGALLTGLAHAFFDFNLHVFANNMTLALVAGVAVSSMEGVGERKGGKAPLWKGIVCCAGIFLIALFVLVQSLRLGASYGYAWIGQRQSLLFEEGPAKKSYERSLGWMSDYWVPLLKEAEIYRGRSLWEREPKERMLLADQAHKLYDQALRLNPYETDIQYGKSQLYGMHGDREAAMACLQEVLDVAPNEVFFLNQMGIQLRLAGRPDEAKPCFLRAMELSPNEISAMNLQLIRRAEERAKAPTNQ